MEQKGTDLEETEELAKKKFESDLLELETTKPKLFSEYHKLLLRNEISSAKENNGKPVTITTEEKRHLLSLASINISMGVDMQKVEKDFEEYGFPTKGSEPKSNYEPDE